MEAAAVSYDYETNGALSDDSQLWPQDGFMTALWHKRTEISLLLCVFCAWPDGMPLLWSYMLILEAGDIFTLIMLYMPLHWLWQQ